MKHKEAYDHLVPWHCGLSIMFKTRGVQFPIRTSETGLPIGLIHIERTCPFSTPAGKESATAFSSGIGKTTTRMKCALSRLTSRLWKARRTRQSL